MRAYRVERPGCAPWFEPTQDDARQLVREGGHGSSFERVETGDNKEAQIAFLNDLAHRSYSAGSAKGYEEAKLDLKSAVPVLKAAPPPPAEQTGDRCPTCGRTTAGALATAQSLSLNQARELIESADGWQLERLFEALIGRLGELRNQAARIGAQV